MKQRDYIEYEINTSCDGLYYIVVFNPTPDEVVRISVKERELCKYDSKIRYV